jgi:YHS domain-containing protein
MTARTVLALVILVTLAGCRTNHASEPAPAAHAATVNSYCPIGHEPVQSSVETVSYKGHTVGFCCPGCREMWDATPEAEREAFLAKALKSQEDRVGG